MKNKFSIFTILSLLLISILLNVIVFTCYSEEAFELSSFWTVWIFTFPVNFILATMATLYVGVKNKDFSVRFPPVMYVISLFSLAYFVMGMWLMAIASDATTLPLILELALTFIYIIILVFVVFGIGYIEASRKYTKKKIMYIGLLESDVKSVISYAKNEGLKKDLEKLAEKIRFSDPMSHPSLGDCEEEISRAVALIVAAVKSNGNADISSKINEVETLIDFRNSRCRLLK